MASHVLTLTKRRSTAATVSPGTISLKRISIERLALEWTNATPNTKRSSLCPMSSRFSHFLASGTLLWACLKRKALIPKRNLPKNLLSTTCGLARLFSSRRAVGSKQMTPWMPRQISMHQQKWKKVGLRSSYVQSFLCCVTFSWAASQDALKMNWTLTG